VEFDEPQGIFEASEDARLDAERNIVESLWAF
jgi:hypothetical protein